MEWLRELGKHSSHILLTDTSGANYESELSIEVCDVKAESNIGIELLLSLHPSRMRMQRYKQRAQLAKAASLMLTNKNVLREL